MGMNRKKLRVKPYDSLIVILSGAPAATEIGAAYGLRATSFHGSVCPDHTASSRGGRLFRRRLLRGGEQSHQRPFDRGLPRRRGDLGAKEISHVEHVDHALAKGRHMRGG